MQKTGRNDSCPCGSNKKYKKCCIQKDQLFSLKIKPYIHFTNLRINGFATENMLPSGNTRILVRTEMTSDQPNFYVYMKNISNVLTTSALKVGIPLSLDNISALLLITHDDGSADLYLQNLPMIIEISPKRDINVGEVVYQSGIADVRRMRLTGIELRSRDGIFFCFKIGWKFALFFDLADDRDLDIDAAERSLGNLYRQLSFEGVYAALGNRAVFDKILQAGWFPFIEIIGYEFENLAVAFSASFNVYAEEQVLLKKFDSVRIDAIGQRWWGRPCLSGRRVILESALKAFKRGDAVACLKIVLTEIEGIIQDAHIADTGAGAKIDKLLEYIAKQGIQKAGSGESLFFPKEFLDYLAKYTFGNFDPRAPIAGVVSRHSVGHGGVAAENYTQMRALQAILVLDQIAFYL